MTPEKVERIKNMFAFQKFLKDIMSIFSQYGLSQNHAMRLFKLYGFSALSLLQENPYFLLDVFPELDFKKVDRLALEMGVMPDDKRRISAKILNLLTLAANNEGHTCLPENRLKQLCIRTLDLPVEKIEEALEALSQERRIVKDEVDSQEMVFLYGYYECERYIADKILSMLKEYDDIDNIDRKISSFEEKTVLHFRQIRKKLSKWR